MKNVLKRKPISTDVYYNNTGKKDRDGKPIFERLNVKNFTSKRTFTFFQ